MHDIQTIWCQDRYWTPRIKRGEWQFVTLCSHIKVTVAYIAVKHLRHPLPGVAGVGDSSLKNRVGLASAFLGVGMVNLNPTSIGSNIVLVSIALTNVAR